MRGSRTKRILSEPSRGCRIATGLHLRRGVPALVDDFHRNALLQPPARRSENRAEGFGCAPITANHLADVFRMDAQLKHDHLLPLDRTNLHLFGMVHES